MKKLKILLTALVLTLLSCNPDEDQVSTKSVTSTTNDILLCTFDVINTNDDVSSKSDAAIINWPRWKTGQTIKIKFLDGDIASQEVVKAYANEWTIYANLVFEYVTRNEYADIRIGFNVGAPGAWSVLGMNSTSATTDYQNQPSMRLGPVAANESSRRTILHEFGHALGLVHETTNPAANIKWNLPKVYQYYEDLMGLSKEQVDATIINKQNVTNYSEYDSLSIMHYYIPASLTTDGIGVNEMKKLSTIDMKSINKWYPFPIKSFVESGERIDFIPWQKAIKSPNGKYTLLFNFGILYIVDLANNTQIWQAGNSMYNYKNSCYLQPNGNITIKGYASGFASLERTTWASDTSQFPGAKLYLQDDGNLVLIYNGIIKWSSKSGKL